MLKKVLLVCLFFVGLNISSQETTLDAIAQKTCKYLQSDELQGLSESKKTIKLGVFIINQYSAYEEALNAEGIVIDFSEEDAGRKFGEKIGINMVGHCPDALMALAGEDKESNSNIENEEIFIGEIVSVTGDVFSFIQIEESAGISQKFLWLANFKGSERLITDDLSSIIGTSVKVKYKNTECFSPKLKEYIIRKEIVEIEYLD